jgi:hypothetical protein
MPMYDPAGLYVEPILTGFSVGYKDPVLVGDRVMPEVPVDTQSATYRKFDRSKRVIFPSRREPGAVANEVRGGRWSTDRFRTVEHSLQAAVADEERQQLNSQGGLNNPTFGGALQLDPDEDAANLVMSSLLLERELAIATLVRNTATYPAGNTVTLALADQWDNYAGATSNPIDIIRAAINKIASLVGTPPNRMLIHQLGVTYLENHPDVVARFSNFNLTDDNAFRELTGFDGEFILVTDDKYNTNDIEEATETLAEIWGKDVWIGYQLDEPGLLDLTFGKTFVQRYDSGETRATEQWREEWRKSDLVRTSYKWDLKVTNSSAGYLIKTAFGATAW